jgi:hypothetical protein
MRGSQAGDGSPITSRLLADAVDDETPITQPALANTMTAAAMKAGTVFVGRIPSAGCIAGASGALRRYVSHQPSNWSASQ